MPIFAERRAADLLLRILSQARNEEGAMVLAYVVMPDHVHLLLVPGRNGLRHFMKLLKGRFARFWNSEAGRSGRIWQERYYESVMRGYAQIEHCLQYIHWNPVKAGLCRRAEDYTWSSAGAAREDLVAYVGGGPDRTEVRPSPLAGGAR